MHALKLPDLPFERMNEAEMRAEVIEPILHALGYRTGTEHNILRERLLELRYPHIFLGHKKPEKDPILRGRPDYICEVRGFARWPIEAKPPCASISRTDVEQAFTYAVHPEIRAPLFALCNGRSFLIYESSRGPEAEPLLNLTFADIQEKPFLLGNVLSPRAIRARFPIRPVDLLRPLANGYGSRVRIARGLSRYEQVDSFLEGLPPGVPAPERPNLQLLHGMEHPITGDECFRTKSDGIVADIRMPKMHELMRQFAVNLNLEVNRYVCRDEVISEDPARPNIFECTINLVIPAGSEVIDITTWKKSVTQIAVPCAFYAEATGYFDGTRFIGRYDGRMFSEINTPFIRLRSGLFMRGTFEIEIEAV
jgi:hypothetical protein